MDTTTVGKADASRAPAHIRRDRPFGAIEQRVVRGAVRGWIAGDAADGACPEVEFLIGTELVGRCTAHEPTSQRLRNDDRPIRGFQFLVPEQYRLRHPALRLVARIVNDNIELIGSPLLIPQSPDIVGEIEFLHSPAIEGWALDLLRPARPIVVIAAQRGEICAIASTQSGLEVLSQHGFSGDFRFRIPMLTDSADGLSHVQVFVANTDQRLACGIEVPSTIVVPGASPQPFKFLLD